MLPKRRVLFVDTALPEEVEKALSDGFQGVTTNPSLVAKAPKGDTSKGFMERYLDHMRALADICRKYPTRTGLPSLSVEVFSLEPEEMIKQGVEINHALNYPNLAIKIPISYNSRSYLNVIRELSQRGIKINATVGFSLGQLELAAQAGARFISLFYNRLIDYFNSGENSEGDGQEKALEILSKARDFLDNNSFDCEIILGSIRNPYDVTLGWECGADVVTGSYDKVIPGMLFHEKTDSSVEGFDKDLKAWFGEGQS